MLFHSKFEMRIYMKVVSLNKLDNFHKGRFLSIRRILENAEKVPKDIYGC
jgi:hypothetical protein